MPLIIVAMIILYMITNIETGAREELTLKTFEIKEENDSERYKIVKESILNIYDGKYDIIHNTFNNLIDIGSYDTIGDLKGLLINKYNYCTEEECFKSSLNELASGEMLLILEMILSDVGDDFFIELVDIREKPYNNMLIPILDMNIYKKNKRHKPILESRERINTEYIINKKINETLLLLDEINSYIEETGKRRFKGFEKLNHFAGKNPYSHMGESINLNIWNDTSITNNIKIGEDNPRGFMTTNLMIIPTNYLEQSSDVLIRGSMESINSDSNCAYLNGAFQEDASKSWFSSNSYYACSFNVDLDENIIPLGFVSPNSGQAAIEFKLDSKNKIISFETYNLYDFLKEEYSLDLNQYKNPFFPSLSLDQDNLFILSSSNEYSEDSKVKIYIGFKVIVKEDSLPDNNNLYVKSKYIINSYSITLK